MVCVKSLFSWIVVWLLMGCAAAGPVQVAGSGDRVRVDYTCRLDSGEVAATTQPEIGQDASVPKAEIFRAPDVYQPMACRIGEADLPKPADMGGNKILAFETAVERALKNLLAGLPLGRRTPVVLQPPLYDDLTPGERYYSQARVRVRKKQRQQSLDNYIAMTGRTPRVGEQHTVENVFTSTITAIDEAKGTITLELSLKPGAVYESDLGPAKIEDHGEFYHLIIDAEPGRLVRSGNWVGRVDEVDKRSVRVDWGHPFGHEALHCDVMVREAAPSE